MKTNSKNTAFIISAFVVAIIMALLFIALSCQTPTSLCVGKDSVLCNIEKSTGVSINDIKNGLIVANAVAIGRGLYTAEEAKTVLLNIKSMKNSMTYLSFRTLLVSTFKDYPGLFYVASQYLSLPSMLSDTLISKDDIVIIDNIIDTQISLL